jgi:hypothetical protein
VHFKGEIMKRDIAKELQEKLGKKHACYVLITCDEPSDDGHMQVEMSYQGDATLAAYILHGAQLHLDKQEGLVFEEKKQQIHCFK